ncbi:hypothetical protein Dimus_001601 [Dionaea muscipula]
MGKGRTKGKARKNICPNIVQGLYTTATASDFGVFYPMETIEEASETMDDDSELAVHSDHVPSLSSSEEDVPDESQLPNDLELPPLADCSHASDGIFPCQKPQSIPVMISENLIS